MNHESEVSLTAHRSHGYLPYLLSGLLFGLSWPSYPYVRLEVLAWVWMAPMLLGLRSVQSFRKFLGGVYLAMLVDSIISMHWLLASTIKGALAMYPVSAAIYTVPFVGFYLIRRTLGWRAALWSAPVVWTAWDWVYHGSEGSFGWLVMGVTQSNLTWLFQFVDLTGVWGITFWLVLFNVLIVMTIENGVQSTAFRRIFALEHSPAEAGTPNLARRLAVVSAVMLGLPLAYSASVFIRAELSSSESNRELSVLMVQPNINPWQKSDPGAHITALAKTAALTDRAVKQHQPDLIIWPETAIHSVLLHDKVVQGFTYPFVSRWNAPLLTGTLDLRHYDNPAERPPLLRYEERDTELFNSAVLLTPQPTKPGQGYTVTPSAVYHKQILLPFIERVPLVGRFPWLSRLAIDFGIPGSLSPGREAKPFSFRDNQGREVAVAAPICHEQLYPATLAAMVRNGAQVLALIANEGWFSQTQGAYALMALARLRAIELRRSIARCTNNGVTCFIDPFGRIYDQAPWWEATTVMGQVTLSNELTLYARYPDYFPKACAWLTLARALAALVQKAWSMVLGHGSLANNK